MKLWSKLNVMAVWQGAIDYPGACGEWSQPLCWLWLTVDWQIVRYSLHSPRSWFIRRWEVVDERKTLWLNSAPRDRFICVLGIALSKARSKHFCSELLTLSKAVLSATLRSVRCSHSLKSSWFWNLLFCSNTGISQINERLRVPVVT